MAVFSVAFRILMKIIKNVLLTQKGKDLTIDGLLNELAYLKQGVSGLYDYGRIRLILKKPSIGAKLAKAVLCKIYVFPFC